MWYRMKVKVSHGDEEAVFKLFDAEVEKLAMETCPLLLSMGEACSLFPDEMEIIYGEPILFKVEKSVVEAKGDSNCFKVLSICNEISLLDLFFDKYFTNFDSTRATSRIVLLPDLNDDPTLKESAYSSDEQNLANDAVLSTVKEAVDVEIKSFKRKIEDVVAGVVCLNNQQAEKFAKFVYK
ncbi:hypothetical protein L195_g037413 [Trifolium pratense]|uniref:Replication factor-A carboxy-terminal domain protein n=1 Tax=Trifolium pratense TaxID=57577 RepID=A0A2K3LS74_TRIPR|nr:hypothetical protein L195_g037413 [Trifolium pratense]